MAELVVGFFFDKSFCIRLWSYIGTPLNLGGYMCVPVSIAWAILIFLFMKFLFTPIKKFVGKLPLHGARLLSLTLAVLFALDILIHFMRV